MGFMDPTVPNPNQRIINLYSHSIQQEILWLKVPTEYYYIETVSKKIYGLLFERSR